MTVITEVQLWCMICKVTKMTVAVEEICIYKLDCFSGNDAKTKYKME